MEMTNRTSHSVFTARRKKKRLEKLLGLLFVFIGLMFLNELYNDFFAPGYATLAGLLFIVLIRFYLTSDTVSIVASLLVWFLTLMSSYIAWNGDGIYDTAILAFPGILLLSPLLTGRTVLFTLMLYMLFCVYGIAYATQIELISPNVQRPDTLWQKANNIGMFIVLYAVVLQIIIRDNYKILDRLLSQGQDTKKAKALAEKMATTNTITKLDNEQACCQITERLLIDCAKNNDKLAVIKIRVNHLTNIVTTLGQTIGDQFLIDAAKRLQGLTSNKHMLFHITPQEFQFIVVLQDFGEINQFAHKVLQISHQPIVIEDNRFDLNMSIGIASSPIDGHHYEELKKRASIALSVVRETQADKTAYGFFEQDMETVLRQRVEMVHELKDAIENDEFEVHYQPKFDLQKGTIIGAEALIRWRKPDGNLVRPDLFIPLAESSGLITIIGKKVLVQSCLDCKQWQQITGKEIGVSVNLSPRQFTKGNLPNIVKFALAQAKLPARFLDLEITESIVFDDTNALVKQIQEMTKEGSTIAIDDFGTGYSNLNYISMFNAATLKIDQSFIKDIVENPLHLHLVNAIFHMTEALDIESVAEGIEDEETHNMLVAMGCEYGQGYYWSKPLPYDEFIEYLKGQPT